MQPQLTPVQLWEVKRVCTQAALIPIVYTDESWGPKLFSFTVCKGPKESHAVEIKYINSAAVIGNGGKKERGVSKPHEIGRASFWPQVIVRVIKQTQTNPNKKKHL